VTEIAPIVLDSVGVDGEHVVEEGCRRDEAVVVRRILLVP
jgi:hypothetical protein